MKHVLISSLLLLTVGFSANALAVPAAKSSILHCGCAEDGLSMAYTAITISANSSGHDAHVATSPDSCFVGIIEAVEVYNDFVRTGSDCQLSGPPLGDPIAACGLEQEAGVVCGEEILDE